jgi:DNA-directed RNA polymerase subunit RPC12/RpoP
MPAATLGSLLDLDHELVIGCNECQHRVVADIAALIETYGRSFPVPQLAQRGRCERCGKKNVTVSG